MPPLYLADKGDAVKRTTDATPSRNRGGGVFILIQLVTKVTALEAREADIYSALFVHGFGGCVAQGAR
jgi:hypothetical protein